MSSLHVGDVPFCQQHILTHFDFKINYFWNEKSIFANHSLYITFGQRQRKDFLFGVALPLLTILIALTQSRMGVSKVNVHVQLIAQHRPNCLCGLTVVCQLMQAQGELQSLQEDIVQTIMISQSRAVNMVTSATIQLCTLIVQY